MSSTTNKSRVLRELFDLGFRVPPFKICRRDGTATMVGGGLSPEALIVRPCSAAEDGMTASRAGQLSSIGPVNESQSDKIVVGFFEDRLVDEIIVQNFIDQPSGVLFCRPGSDALFEFSRAAAAVTSGAVSPYTALLPSPHERYAGVNQVRELLETHFGACNAELTFEESPWVFQARPITHPIVFDRELAELRMRLQELSEDTYAELEFCTDVLESPHHGAALITVFCQVRNKLIDDLALTAQILRVEDFIHFPEQVLVAPGRLEVRVQSNSEWFRIGSWLCKLLQRYLTNKRPTESPEQLMELAIGLRLTAALVDRLPQPLRRYFGARLIRARGVLRDLLLAKLERNGREIQYHTTQRICGTIEKNSSAMQWISCNWSQQEGQEVVAGSVTEGPFVWIRTSDIPDPDKVVGSVIVCDQLYPSLLQLFSSIRGIVCSGGAHTSHLAILAREYGMPLKIQVTDAFEKYVEGTSRVPPN